MGTGRSMMQAPKTKKPSKTKKDSKTKKSSSGRKSKGTSKAGGETKSKSSKGRGNTSGSSESKGKGTTGGGTTSGGGGGGVSMGAGNPNPMSGPGYGVLWRGHIPSNVAGAAHTDNPKAHPNIAAPWDNFLDRDHPYNPLTNPYNPYPPKSGKLPTSPTPPLYVPAGELASRMPEAALIGNLADPASRQRAPLSPAFGHGQQMMPTQQLGGGAGLLGPLHPSTYAASTPPQQPVMQGPQFPGSRPSYNQMYPYHPNTPLPPYVPASGNQQQAYYGGGAVGGGGGGREPTGGFRLFYPVPLQEQSTQQPTT